jgi:hypothetical protein
MIEIKVSASVLLNAYRDPAETTWLHTTFRTDDCIDKPPPSGAKNRVNAPANNLLRKIIDAVLFQVTRGIL